MKKKTLFSLLMMLVSLTSWAQTIRLHANYPEYNKRQGNGSAGITVPSDNKTDWAEGDMIFFTIDGGDGNKACKAIYNGYIWDVIEWYKNGGMPDFRAEGGMVTFAMSGENLNLSADQPSNYAESKTTLRTLTNYAGGKVSDIIFDNAGTYTLDENGEVDIYLNFTRPLAKIHIRGAYLAAMQIRNQIEGTMPGGVDNAGGTNANYNKSKKMTLGQIVRYQPSTQTFRDAMNGNGLNGTANMVYETRPEDPQVIDAVYYGNMEPDENGDITIVMCQNARTYPGIEANAALGDNGQVAYWRKFHDMAINPNDDIYIYGPLSEEEGHLWTSQAITSEMDFTKSETTLIKNQHIDIADFCKWKSPTPTDRFLTFSFSDPSIATVSDDGLTLTALDYGTTTITATTKDGYSSTMTINVGSEIKIDETNFPDENFRNHILSLYYGEDGMLTENEIANVTGIYLYNQNIQSLKGIEHFTALKELYCHSNQLTTLDVSKNTALKGLYCYSNQLTTLDVSKNTVLERLYCSSNKLTTIEVSKNMALKVLNCHSNQFTSLDVSKNTELEELYCGGNQLTTLDVTKNTALTWMYCDYNQLSSLDVSKNTALKHLNCGGNLLTSLDVSQNMALERLYCYTNKLMTLDVMKNMALEVLNCHSNQFTSLDVSKNTELKEIYCGRNKLVSLDVSNNTALTLLYCNNNQLNTLDVSRNTALKYMDCSGNLLTSLDVSQNTALEELYCSYSQLTTLDVSRNTALARLYCHRNQIKGTDMDALIESLPTVDSGSMFVIYNNNEENRMTRTQVAAAKAKGWKPQYYCYGWYEYAGYDPSSDIEINEENFPDENFRKYLFSQDYGADGFLSETEIANVTQIYVYFRDIQSLKGIEYFTALTSLDCYNNQLTTLDVSKNTALKRLYCHINRLTSLDVSKNTALEYLYCYSNQLTTLDVSKNTALKTLDCHGNQLTTLDVSGCTALTGLYCYKNRIKGSGMDALVESLPTVSRRYLYVIYNEGEANVMNTTQVSAAKAKGWIPAYCTGEAYNEQYYYYYDVWQAYAGSEPKPDVPRGDVNDDDIVNGTDIQAIINLIVDGGYDEKADVNGDNVVNGTDIQEVINIIVSGQ